MSYVKVSIIVPCYNTELYISECLDSLINQTLQEIEIIAVENNSKDNTKTILEKYAKKYPEKVFVTHQPVQGVSASRNMGLELARGKYVGFVDSDDFVVPEMFEKLYDMAEENNSDFIIFEYDYCLRGNEINRRVQKIKQYEQVNIFKTVAPMQEEAIILWNKLYKADVIKKYDLKFDEKIGYGEDMLFSWTYIFYADNICSLNEPLYSYRMRDNSATTTLNKNILTVITSCEKIADFYKEKGYFDKFKGQLLWMSVGYFRRKMMTALYANNRFIVMAYINAFFNFYNNYYKADWKRVMCEYWTGGNKKIAQKNRYLTNKKLLAIIIYTPNWIKKLILRIKTAKSNYLYLKNIPGKYLKYHKKLKINDKQIFFNSNLGFYYIANEFLNKEYTIYIQSNNFEKDAELLKDYKLKINFIKHNSSQYLYALATSEYIVIDSNLPAYFIKRPGQILINSIWNGTPFFTFGFLSQNFGACIQSQLIASDYLVFSNEFSKENIIKSYSLENLYSNNVLITGYPKNSIFFKKENADMLKKKLGIENKKIYVYWPSGRDWKTTNKIKEFFIKLDKEIETDTIIFTWNMANCKHIRPFPSNITSYELLNIADCLITDYSSVLFDFANTGREILLFTFDAEEILKQRETYISLDELPFTKIYDIADLISYINNTFYTFKPSFAPLRSIGMIPKNYYNNYETYETFQKKYCAYDSISASNYINGILSSKQISKYSNNKSFNVYFISNNIKDEDELAGIFLRIESDPHALLVIAEGKFNDIMNEFIRNIYNIGIPCMIVNTNTPLTPIEKICMKFYKKLGLFKKTIRNICLREKERLFPCLVINQYINLSNEILFKYMEQFL